MSLKSHFANLTAGIDLDTKPAKSPGPATGPTTAPGQLAEFSSEFQKLEERNRDLLAQRGDPIEIALDVVDDSPYQTRKLDPAKLAELVEQLRNNRLVTPIVVRRRGDRFEIVAGHHRAEAFRVLGRATIPAIVAKLSDDEAERAVFYDNLFAPQLADFERFRGFQRRKQSRGMTDAELADEAGVSRALVTSLMAFERLPEAVQSVLDSAPRAVGSTLAVKLAALPPTQAERITEAVRMVAAGELSQSSALSWIRATPAPAAAKPVTIRRGKAKYADLVRRQGKLTVVFASESDAVAFEHDLKTILTERAKQR